MRSDHDNQPLNHSFAHLAASSLQADTADQHYHVRISRNTLLAILFSLLLHALLFFAVPQISFDTPASMPARAIQVRLAPPQIPTQVIEPESQAEQPIVTPPPQVQPKPVPVTPPKTAVQRAVPDKKSAVAVPQLPIPESIPDKPQPKELPVEQQFTDMASYVKAMQAKRKQEEAVAAQVNAEAAVRERGPTEAQLRDERIKNNLKYGTNGIFEIVSMGPRHATFAFRGWTNDYLGSKREFYEVEASSGQDIRLVMIRRMIILIREHYDGNFNWESHRLGRTVVQSARPEDNAGLEDFLMMEFFGSNYRTMQY